MGFPPSHCIDKEIGSRIEMGESMGFTSLEGEQARVRLDSDPLISLLANDMVKYPYAQIKIFFLSTLVGL